MKHPLLRWGAVLVLVAGCESTPPPNVLPTPFTAAELRDAHPSGTELVFRLTDETGRETLEVMRFLDADEDGVVFDVWHEDAAGNTLDEPQRAPRTTWAALRDHARFERGVRQRMRANFPSGPFDGWLYTVPTEAGVVQHYYFSAARPGPPERLETIREGERVQLMEFVARRPPAADEPR